MQTSPTKHRLKTMKITNPAYDYDTRESSYATIRKTDKRIASHVLKALGNAKTVLNIGAGTGSYEPDDRYVLAVEPSKSMRNQRLLHGRSPAVQARADSLPFDKHSFDAAMAIITLHHWLDIPKGLQEMARVADTIVLLTFDPDSLSLHWNAHYFPELIAVEKQRFPSIEYLQNYLPASSVIRPIPVPFDCHDGFQEAFYGRPEAFLNPLVRKSQSAWGFVDDKTETTMVKRLADDLESGEWDKKFGHFRKMPFFLGALRLIICRQS